MMDSIRARIADLIGLTPPAASVTPEIGERQACDGYSRTLLHFVAPDQERVDAFLFAPAGRAPLGGVLALHQHNSQWSIGKSEIAGLGGDPLQAFGPALARRGVSVLAPDTVGFESRVRPTAGLSVPAPNLTRPGASVDGWLQYYNEMAHRLVRGDLLMRKMLTDWQAAVSVLRAALPSGTPLGVMGHSMGGGVALFLAALDTRLGFTCSSGALGSYRRRLARGIGLEMALIIPGFASQFDVDDLLRCIAPRPLFVVSADGDLACDDATELVLQVHRLFHAPNGEQRLRHLRSAGGHALDHPRFDAIVDWVVAQCGAAGHRRR
jgi:dienelactone hydrolase